MVCPDLNCNCFFAVFSRLQKRQAQFFQEASVGLLALVRLAAQDDGDDDEEDEESVHAIDGYNLVPLKQVRAAIVDDIVQVAQTVRETCDAVDVRDPFRVGRSWQGSNGFLLLYLIVVLAIQVLLVVSFWEYCTVRTITKTVFLSDHFLLYALGRTVFLLPQLA